MAGADQGWVEVLEVVVGQMLLALTDSPILPAAYVHDQVPPWSGTLGRHH